MSLTDLSSWSTWTPLANHLWQSTIFVAVVCLLALALKTNRAAVRYWLWFAASVKFLLPFSLLVTLGSKLDWRTAPVLAQPQWSSVVDNVAQPFVATAPVVQTVAPHSSFPLPAILLGVWLCGVAVGVVFWLRCWWQMRSLRRKATPLALGLPIPVLSSPSRIEPGVFGILRPVLLLPEGIADRLTKNQLDAILAHEMCHVRRRDNLTAAIHMVVETVFWFFPLVWWLRVRLVEEREQACDEEVLRSGSEAESYAEGIIHVCKSYAECPSACISAISGSDLKKRIIRIANRGYGENLSRSKKFALAIFGVIAVLAPLAIGLANAPLLHAQSGSTDWEKAAGGKMAFEVASVKQNFAPFGPGTVHSNISIDISNSDDFTPTGGRFYETDFPLFVYVDFAYKLSPDQAGALNSELPKWVVDDRFDIEATSTGNPTKDQYRLMLQALLADRFKMTAHFETRQGPVDVLVLAKGKTGPLLQTFPDGTPCSNTAPPSGGRGGPSFDTLGPTPDTVDDGRFPAYCGLLGHGGLIRMPPSEPGDIRVGARNVSWEQIKQALILTGGLVKKPVLDRTGLSGQFDVAWESAPNPPPGTLPSDETGGPTFLDAMKDQLGIKLESTTGPTQVLVIDHIEEPTPN